MADFFRYFPKVRGGSSTWSDGSPASTILINETFGVSSGTQNLDVPLLTNTNTLFAPTIVPQAVVVELPLLSNTNTLYAPTVVPGAVSVTLPLISSTNALFSPTVVPGAVVITTPLINSTTVLYSPSVSPQAVAIALPLIASSGQLYAPVIAPGAVALTLPLLNNVSVLYDPSISQIQVVRKKIVRNSRITKYAAIHSGVCVLIDINSKTKKGKEYLSPVSTVFSKSSKITIKKTLQSLL
jgi:hypothetical protein